MNSAAPDSSRRLAAIDIGTNSFHLVVVDVKPNGSFTIRGRERETVRLGEGMTDMKHLGDEAMDRAIRVLQRFRMIAENHRSSIRAVATSAVREALNGDAFVSRVWNEVGIEMEVVSGFEEARLIYLGVLQALPVFDQRILLIDIGGGSTEFLVGESGIVHYANSLKVGAVRFWRRFFQDKQLTSKAVQACREHLRGEKTLRSRPRSVDGFHVRHLGCALLFYRRETTHRTGIAFGAQEPYRVPV